MTNTDWVCALAPAKINAGLEILGKREDGFHELRTVMVCLDLADEVRVRESSTPAVRVVGPHATDDIPTDSSNLVVAAIEAWLAEYEVQAALEIELTKNVPSQAGLGGGSADAAAGILAVSSLLQIPISRTRVQACLGALGSDCVFFASAEKTGAALCEGRGERVTPCPAPSPSWHVALVVPELRIATRGVYAAIGNSLRGPEGGHSLHPEVLQFAAVEARPWIFNDLEYAAQSSVPELSSWRDLLAATESEHFRLSGSGSAFFGLFESREEAHDALQRIEQQALHQSLSMRASFVTQTVNHGAHVRDTTED